MNQYAIVSDGTLDLNAQCCRDLDIHVIPMEFTLEGTPYKHYADARELSYQDFYDAMRQGKFSTTSQINYKTFTSFSNRSLNRDKIFYISALPPA